MNKLTKAIIIILGVLIILLSIKVAFAWTPINSIDMKNTYSIINATNISSNYYCNVTNSCYTINQLLNTTNLDYLRRDGTLNMTGNMNTGGFNITVSNLLFTNNHYIYDNSTCIVITGSTSTLNIC